MSLSVVIRVVGGAAFTRRCLSHLARQSESGGIEIIVPYDAAAQGIEQLPEVFPDVTFVSMGTDQADDTHPAAAHERYDRRTGRGLREAQGDIVALIEDTAIPDPDWCEQVLKAHRELAHGVIGGAVEHAGKGALNWAVYLLDFGRYGLPLREGPVAYLTDVNVSYKRAALAAVQPLWEDKYNEVTVHAALARRGVTLWLRPQIVVRQDRGKLRLPELLRERFSWGQLFGRVRARELSPTARAVYIALSPAIPFVLVGRAARKAFSGQRRLPRLVLPATIVLAWCWVLGELSGYVRTREPFEREHRCGAAAS